VAEAVSQHEDESSWRSRALGRVYLVLALAAGLPGLFLAFALEERLLAALLGCSLPLIAAGAFRARDPREFRFWTWTLLVLLLLLPIAAVTTLGPTPGAVLPLATLIVFSGVFLGGRAAWGATALVVAALVVVGECRLHGLSPTPRFAIDWSSRPGWVRLTLNFVAEALLLCVPVATLLARYQRGLVQRGLTLQRLESERRASLRAAGERRAAQSAVALAQRGEMVGRLGAGLAHDFNNALTVVRCWSDVLQDGGSAAERAEALESILGAARRATALTRRMVALSRRGGGPSRSADLGHTLRELEKTLAQLLPADVQLTVRAQPGLTVALGELQLEQVLLNLVLNARDAMPSGGTLQISAAASPEAEARRVLLEVADSGCGMGPEVMARLFEPFFTTKPEEQGTGLGLVSSRAIVEEAGGTIAIASRPGAGTRVTLGLPQADAPGEVQGAAGAAAAGAGARALLVEPDEAVGRVTALALRARGFTVLEERSARNALELVRRQRAPLDLLCVDVSPGAPGAERLVDEFLALHGGAPVLASSSDLEPLQLQTRCATGQVAFLAKPFSATELAERAAQLLAAARRTP
jgi:signal transduction histidine kinase/CheY-like chemotaxis protein